LEPGVQFYAARYFAPVSAACFALLPLGLVGLRARWVLVGLAPVAVACGLQGAALHRATAQLEDDTRALHTEVAQWVARNLPADAVVAVEGAGALRYFTPRGMRIIDMVGLNDRELAHAASGAERLCGVVRRAPTHVVAPVDFLEPLGRAFLLEPLETFRDPHWTQVQPARPAATTVLAVRGVTPAAAAACHGAEAAGRPP
jgi:hypothetical protein